MLPIPAISNPQKAALGFGFLALFFANQGIQTLATPYFQMQLKIDPFLLALVMTVPIGVGAFLSPWIGQVSDGFSSRWGRRKPFILAGGWAAGLLFGLIWMVPPHWPHSWILSYFLILSLLFYVATAFLTINVRCLAYETADQPKQRTLVMAYTSLYERGASIVYFWLYPLAQASVWGSLQVGIQMVGWAVGVILIALFSLLTSALGQERNAQSSALTSHRQAEPCTQASASIAKAFRLLLLLLVLKLGVIAVCASFDFYLLVYFVCGGDIGLGAQWKGVLSSAYAIFGLLAIPVVAQLAIRFGRRRALMMLYSLACVGALSKWFIYTPGSAAWVVLDALLGAPCWVAISTIIPAMIAELCAKERENSGQSREGYFASRQSKMMNIGAVIAVVGSGLLLNLVGFDAALGGEQSSSSILTMRLLLAGGEFLFSLISIWLIRAYPYDD